MCVDSCYILTLVMSLVALCFRIYTYLIIYKSDDALPTI